MKIGLIADIHGNFPAFKSVMSLFDRQVDKILFAGDLAGYYPFVNECINLWNEDRIISVLGNHDYVLLECLRQRIIPEKRYNSQFGFALERSLKNISNKTEKILKSWPKAKELTIGKKSILIIHGAPWDSLNGRVYPDFNDWVYFDKYPYDIFILGQTHYPLVKIWKKKMIINPGSVGQARDKISGACCAILNTHSDEVTHFRVVYDASTVITDAKKYNPDIPYLYEILKNEK